MTIERSDERRLLTAAHAIATITADYAPAGGMTCERVLVWSERFEPGDRATIVHELAAVLEGT